MQHPIVRPVGRFAGEMFSFETFLQLRDFASYRVQPGDIVSVFFHRNLNQPRLLYVYDVLHALERHCARAIHIEIRFELPVAVPGEELVPALHGLGFHIAGAISRRVLAIHGRVP